MKTNKIKRKSDGDGSPTPPLHGYEIFNAKERKKIQLEKQGCGRHYADAFKRHCHLNSIISERWKNIDHVYKQELVKKARVGKIRFCEEMKEWQHKKKAKKKTTNKTIDKSSGTGTTQRDGLLGGFSGMSTNQGAQLAGDLPFGGSGVRLEVPLCIPCNDSTPAVTAPNFPCNEYNLGPAQVNYSGRSSDALSEKPISKYEYNPPRITEEVPPMLAGLIDALWDAPDPTCAKSQTQGFQFNDNPFSLVAAYELEDTIDDKLVDGKRANPGAQFDSNTAEKQRTRNTCLWHEIMRTENENEPSWEDISVLSFGQH
eukprot:scaffold42376_cov70-Cyclotella_meneghiniana.AAC.1